MPSIPPLNASTTGTAPAARAHDDGALVQQTLAGRRDAFAGLVQRHQQPLFGFLGRMGFTQAQAEDIAQDTFIKAWTHLERFNAERAQFNTWLFSIARHLALNVLAKTDQHWVFSESAFNDMPSEQPNPEQQLQSKQDQQQLQAALRRLPVADRSLVALFYVQGLSIDDVARLEGISVPAVKTRLHRARHHLSALLNPHSPSIAP